MIRLVLTSRNREDQSCLLDDGHYKVGRSRRNDIVIRDESVSGEHCELLVYGWEAIVRECGSRNGTYVEEDRIGGQSGLKPGQTMTVGRVQLRVEAESRDEGNATSFTAMDDFRTFKRQTVQPSPHATVLPIIFAPSGSG